MKVYLDFDGTVVEHQYPNIGRCNFGCFEVIKKIQDAGHEVILNTYRSECNDNTLKDALEYINEDSWMMVNRSLRDTFELKPIQAHPSKIQPYRWEESLTNGHILFIDDQAYGTPLKPAAMIMGNVVDWAKVEEDLIKYKII